MYKIMHINEKQSEALVNLGMNLRRYRLQKNDSQATFAERIGISRATYIKLEQGDHSVAIGYWIKAFTILGRLHEWSSLLEQNNLFELYEFEQSRKTRKRAKRKTNDKT